MPNNRFSPHRLGNSGSALVMAPYVATSSFFISRNGDVVDIPSFCTSHKTTFRNPDKESADCRCRLLSTQHVGNSLTHQSFNVENGFHGKSPASCTVTCTRGSNIRNTNDSVMSFSTCRSKRKYLSRRRKKKTTKQMLIVNVLFFCFIMFCSINK